PAPPSPPSPSPAPSPAPLPTPATPTITSISPGNPAATGTGNQTVSVFGTNFQSDLTSVVTYTGVSSTVSGTQIQHVTAMSFRMVTDYGAGGGSWSIRVNNPGGQQSNAFNFNVQPAPTTALTITSISPGNPAATGTGNQTVSVFGTNFQ